MSEFIKVGGQRIDIKLRFIDVENLHRRFVVHSYFAIKLKKRGREYNWNNFFFWCVWYVMEKKGIWIFKKPFRSFKKMRQAILDSEYQDICEFVSHRILKVKSEDKESKNEVPQ